jgi:hypothetical protein
MYNMNGIDGNLVNGFCHSNISKYIQTAGGGSDVARVFDARGKIEIVAPYCERPG